MCVDYGVEARVPEPLLLVRHRRGPRVAVAVGGDDEVLAQGLAGAFHKPWDTSTYDLFTRRTSCSVNHEVKD